MNFKVAIPPGLTIAGFCLSLYAIVTLFRGEVFYSMGILLFAFICDLLDGHVARRMKIESRWGRYADSVADVPLYLLYPVALFALLYDDVIVLASGLLLICAGVFRLIRFAREGFVSESGLYYRGLPVYFTIPYVLIIATSFGFQYVVPPISILFINVVLSILMISTIHVPKETNAQKIIALGLSVALAGSILVWMH
ncbi:MAG: CDP-diacylglycerol--serine O-phosphatidyltransferase [Candidatus Parcubacteria bacterium]